MNNGTTAAATRKKVGRPKGSKTKNRSEDPRDIEIAQLREQLVAISERKPTLDPIPSASADLPPGSYIRVGVDAANSPIMAKIRHTRRTIEEMYLPVTFIPKRDMDVGPHGVMYKLVGGEPNTVPGICKDIYDETIRGEQIEASRYRQIRPEEAHQYAEAAVNQPGQKIWSRLYRAGFGLSVRQDDPGEDIG